jgi:hypothetical protein
MVKFIKLVFFSPFKILMLHYKWDLALNGNMFVEPIQTPPPPSPPQ